MNGRMSRGIEGGHQRGQRRVRARYEVYTGEGDEMDNYRITHKIQ